MSLGTARTVRASAALVLAALLSTACGGTGLLQPQYEYEEDLYPALDGSVTLYVNASLASLVALRGLDLPTDPAARVDRPAIRKLYQAPGVDVGTPTLSRRDGRRFVHLRLEAESLAALSAVAPLSWSRYQLTPAGEEFHFRHQLGPSAGRQVGDVGWTGQEIVAFRVHPPSRILFHNSKAPIARGNILVWQQPLRARLAGEPLDLQVRMEASSILARTLLLFGSTILAAVVAFGIVVWWVARKGKVARS
ncbi:MAG: hypothetical protein AB7I25_13070 [Vicinamibacterales bacterium]